VAGLQPVDAGPAGRAELRRWLEGFLDAYRRHGPVIRSWMESQAGGRDLRALADATFADVVGALDRRLADDGSPDGAPVRAVALLAMVERFAYFVVSRRLEVDEGEMLDTLSLVAQRGFFTPADR
jgi:hypothetical protein